MTDAAPGKSDKLDPVWKALSDPTRRAILDLLRDRPRTTSEVVESFSYLTRFGVMKHLDVLRQAQLVHTREVGRQRLNSLNAVPIRQIYERWVSPFQELWSSELLRIKEAVEMDTRGWKPGRSRRRNKNFRRLARGSNLRAGPKTRTIRTE